MEIIVIKILCMPQVAKEGLQESDGWGRLTSELEDLFEKNDIVGACDKLKSLQKSLAAQMGLSGQHEREAQVDGFKNRLEALASPAVVQCFVSGDIGNINTTQHILIVLLSET